MSRKRRHYVPPPAASASGTTVVLGVVAVLVAVGGAVGLRMGAGDDLRDRTVALACWLTSCSAPGTAVIGWLMTASPLLYAGLTILLWRRVAVVVRAGLVALGVTLFGLVVCFLPTKGGPKLADLVRGPGAEALVTGMNWGLLTIAGSVAALIALAIAGSGRPVRPWAYPVVLTLVGAGMLAAAVLRAEPARPVAATLFAPALTVNDDVLTRTSATERDGCDGVLADAAVLDGCLRTYDFGFTTSDSDAVIRFFAVMYASDDGASDARGRFRDGTRPAGAPGDALVVPEVTGAWLTVAVVGHPDGRAITVDEQRWLRWPAAQLRYAFARAIDHSLATEPEPSGSVAPRTG